MKYPSIAVVVLLNAIVFASPDSGGVWTDAQGDAVIRRTDIGADAPLPAEFVPIDLLSVVVEGWSPSSPTMDLYSGSVVNGDADFVRIQIFVDGLVAPPGPIGLNGFPYNPYQFGDRPITGFIDLDIDRQKNSGGELMPIARNRYLANVARFGLSPLGSIADRMVQDGDDIDSDIFVGPQFERTGAEFTLIMCGCFAPVINSQNGNMNSLFEAGETMVVGGRFFERFESFDSASLLFNGSDFGLFDPTTALQFAHDIVSDITTITLVFPITNAGAALEAGQSEQPIDLNLLNQTSMEEAIDDLILGANSASGSLAVLVNGWDNNQVDDFRDPTRWDATALIGTAPLIAQPASFYVWTDTGFDELVADLNLDELNTVLDDQILQGYIDVNDGTAVDADSVVNGEVAINNFGIEFHFYDLNYDGVVSAVDLPNPPCVADLTHDGVLNFFDISAFLSLFSAQDPLADFTNDGSFNFFDVSAFLQAFAAGCP